MTKEKDSIELIREAVSYYLAKTSFRCLVRYQEKDDILQTVYYRLLAKKSLTKYDGSTTLYYYICVIVRNVLIDMVTQSMRHKNAPVRNSVQIDDFDLPCSFDNELCTKLDEEFVINSLPKSPIGELRGYSPELGEVPISYYTLVYHLNRGYSVKDLAGMFSVSASYLYALVRDVKNYIKRNLVEQDAYCLV